MIERTIVDGRQATVAYLHSDWSMADGPADADLVKVIFDGGGVLFLKPRGARTTDTITPLYIERDVINVKDLQAWAHAAGLPSIIEDLHVTQLYSSEPVDWSEVATSGGLLHVQGPGRPVRLGENVVALQFDIPQMQARHEELLGEGASHDFPSYIPHVSITQSLPPDFDVDTLPLYEGELQLAPEKFEQLKDEAEVGLFDFNPNHEQSGPTGGQFTSGSGGGGTSSKESGGSTGFVSPNIHDLKIEQAATMLNSVRQGLLSDAVKEIHAKLGLSANSAAVIGAWSDGAENSVMVSFDGSNPELEKAALAMEGYIADQKAVLYFHPDPAAAEWMARFTAQGEVVDVHNDMLQRGLAFHTLRPTSNGAVVVYVYGQDKDTLKKFGEAANAHKAEFAVTRGKGEFIGTKLETGSDREQRDDARRVYAAAIGAASGGKVGPVWAELRDRWTARLEQSRDRQGHHGRSAAGGGSGPYAGRRHPQADQLDRAFGRLAEEAGRRQRRWWGLDFNPYHEAGGSETGGQFTTGGGTGGGGSSGGTAPLAPGEETKSEAASPKTGRAPAGKLSVAGGDDWNRAIADRLASEFEACRDAVAADAASLAEAPVTVSGSKASWDELGETEKDDVKWHYVDNPDNPDGAGDAWDLLSDKEKFKYAASNGMVPASSEDKVLSMSEPAKLDPMQMEVRESDQGTGGGKVYVETQQFAKALSIRHTTAVMNERESDPSRPIDESDVAQMDSDLWEAWKGSSTSNSGALLQLATAEELGGRVNLHEGILNNVGGRPAIVKWADTRFSATGGYNGVKAYIRGKWETTQYLLEKAGIDEVTVYRSVHQNEKDRGRVEEVKAGGVLRKLPEVLLQRNGAASFSVDRETANAWGLDDRTVMRAAVPRTAVLSVPAYGANVAREREVVLAGTAWHGWDAWLGTAPPVDQVPLAYAKVPAKQGKGKKAKATHDYNMNHEPGGSPEGGQFSSGEGGGGGGGGGESSKAGTPRYALAVAAGKATAPPRRPPLKGLDPASNPAKSSAGVTSTKLAEVDSNEVYVPSSVATMRKDARVFAHNMGLFSNAADYPGMRADQLTGPPDAIARQAIETIKGNIGFLYDKATAAQMEAKDWYKGAHSLVRKQADKYGLPVAAVAGVYAALSPQKDWDQNVHIAGQMIDIFMTKQDAPWDDAMEAKGSEIFAKPIDAKMLGDIKGKKLGELTDPLLIGAWIRTYEQAHGDPAQNGGRNFRVFNPKDGSLGEFHVNQDKVTKTTVTWNNNKAHANAIRVLISNGDRLQLSKAMGAKHKVSNFYNNILDPTAKDGDVTMDSHAMHAAWIRPVAEMAIAHGLALGGPKGSVNSLNSARVGTTGIYGLYADAYRELAAERGILPVELQAVVWTVKRDHFEGFKPDSLGRIEVDRLWTDYNEGRATLPDTREAVWKVANANRSK